MAAARPEARQRRARANPGKRVKPGRPAAQGAAGAAPRSRVISWIAGGVSLAMIGTIAVLASGYDARETPREEPSVWAVRSAGQYARVNTLTAEIDTVRKVDEPSGVLQSGASGVVLSHGGGRAWVIDPALPGDLVDAGAPSESAPAEGAEATPAVNDEGSGAAAGPVAMRTPDGTRDILSSDDGVVFRTEDGRVYFSAYLQAGDDATGEEPRLGDPVQLDPLAHEKQAQEAPAEGDADAAAGAQSKDYHADAVAIDADGRISMYSSAEQAVRGYDIDRGAFERGMSEVPEGAPTENLQFTTVAGEWAMLDGETGDLWREGSADPVALALEGTARLQAASPKRAGPEVLVADEGGLWSVVDAAAERADTADGVPAQPIALGEVRHAAWIGASEGRLWSSDAESIPLELDGSVKLPGDPEVAIRSNGSSALVTEVKTGMMWTVPDGTLIPVDQWSLADPPREQEGVVVVDDVTEQVPPVAVADAFGVRAGEQAPLPVLLNDFDPNRKDVLTIVPEGLGEGLPEAFGTVSMLPDGQSLVVAPSPAASGSATFSYRITDGVLVSEPASVTLTVADPGTNTAPTWCPVEGCQREWPSPELAPGGTLVMPILEGWVDPEGDPMMLESARLANPDDPARVLVTADGRFAIRHVDPNAPDSDISVMLRVADAHGEATERELRVQVRSNARAELLPIAATAEVGRTIAVRPLPRVVGGSGSVVLVDASVLSGSATSAVNAGAGTVSVTAREAGSTVIALTLRDTVTDAEITGNVRVTAVEARTKLGLPPLHAFVRPLADSTVDVLAAVPSANSRELVVRTANVVDGELRADVIEHATVRVAGSTPDGAPGRIGAADITIAEGDDVAVGRLTVFQVPDTGSLGAIAVADAATVRAGDIADIRVLDNDVAPPGQRLVLHPEISGSGTSGELAFASGNTLRYLAPQTPGTYTVSYTTYSASSPEASDVGQVRVTVLPREGNRDPQPSTLTVRVAPGERATAQVPLSGVDPDGDRVRLMSVGASDDPQLTATLAPRSSAVQVSASTNADPGTRAIKYTVRDDFGGKAEGTLRVIVTEADPAGGAPVTYSDYVRLEKGVADPATVRPLDNDVDPANGRLELVEVVPNVPGGAESPEYRDLAARLDTSDMKQGRIAVRGGAELGTVSYRYTARSKATTSTADGLIVVQTSARVGQQAPMVRDTVLSAKDRAELERGGVDVVTDRVTWAGGDVRTLKMAVWGSAAENFMADGNRITGTYRAEGDRVPFKLSGVDATGAEVSSFGFLVIPPLDELRLTFKPGLKPIKVGEGKSVDIALADIIDLASGDRAEFQTGALPTQRGQASCEARSATSLTYSAGKEAPWADTCVISVKLAEQQAWTQLALPIEIVPDSPVVELETLTRTVQPGFSETIDLADMVRWQGGREGKVGDLAFSVSGGGGAFEVALGGRQLTVQARADAVPGTQDALIVAVTGAGESRAPLTLRVGEAPRDTPRGATVQLSCTVGSNCQAQLIGAPGEYDPFQGKSGGGLKLEGVSAGSCAVASFQSTGEGVAVAWPNGAQGPGGTCTASFTVRDAQNRVGQGTIELDAQGIPRPPAGISQTGYTGNSVTLTVTLSGEASYPATTGVRLLMDGRAVNASCSGGGSIFTCVVGGLNNGEQHVFSAIAVNAVGDSAPSANAATAWAYERPAAPMVTAKQVSAESSDTGTVRFDITGAQGTKAYRLITAAGETTISGKNGSPRISGIPVGSSQFTVIPLSEFTPPPGDSSEGSQVSENVTVSGLPVVSVAFESSEQGSESATVSVGVDPRGGSAVKYGAGIDGCRANISGTGGSVEVQARGKTYQQVSIVACAENEWGPAPTRPAVLVSIGGSPPQPVVTSGWTISTSANVGNRNARYEYTSGPTVENASGHQLDYRVNGESVGRWFPNTVEAGNSYSVAQCKNSVCSEPVEITGNAPGPVTVDLTGCIASTATTAELLARISPHAQGSASPSFDHAAAQLTVVWSGAYSSLSTLVAPVCAEPDPTSPDPPTTP
ncbi:Ig-like domain-containing protein [Leucobacter sp. GX0328]